MAVTKKPKLRSQQVVLDELAKVFSQGLAIKYQYEALLNKEYDLRNELQNIINQEVK